MPPNALTEIPRRMTPEAPRAAITAKITMPATVRTRLPTVIA